MRAWGETDLDKKTIRIKKSKDPKKVIGHIKNKKGNTLDTIVHEETHRKHPKMREYAVRRKIKRDIGKMGRRAKGKMYALYKK